MSTTVNVRVIGGGLQEELDTAAAAKQQQAAQQAVEEAAAEQIRANNEALRRRQKDAVAKFRESRHDPTARRDGGPVTLPNQLVQGQLTGPVALQNGAAINVARVGVRRNSDGTKIFVYPWSIEAALGRRLSNDYDTAVTEAFAVGVELEFKLSDYPEAEPPLPNGSLPPNAEFIKSFAIENGGYTSGIMYDVSPSKGLLSYIVRGDFYLTTAGWGRLLSQACFIEAPTAEDFPPPGNYPSYTVGYFYLQYPSGGKVGCETYGIYPDEEPGNQSYTVKTLAPVRAESADPPVSGQERIDLFDFILPAGGDKALYVVIIRRLKRFVVVPHYLDYRIRQTLVTDQPSATFALPGRVTRFIDYESDLQVTSTAPYWEGALINEVRCVLVESGGGFAREVPASEQLIEACNELVKELDGNDATGITPPPQGSTAFDIIPSPAFELSNLPKQPYSDSPPEQQVLSKQLGIGYLETSDHSGKFYTPAVYEWLAGNATLTTRYSQVAPAFYQPGDANNPFIGVYLSVGNGTEESIEMRATSTQPIDITNAHTALDWVTINTGSRYGDYLVWDWGNPEYCQQRLQALGMNV